MRLAAYIYPDNIGLTYTFKTELITETRQISQPYRRQFFLRNLPGNSTEERLAAASTIAHDVAAELHHLSGLRIDNCVIRAGTKKIEEIDFEDAFPPKTSLRYARYGIKFQFAVPKTLRWRKDHLTAWQIDEAQLAEGWQKVTISRQNKKTSFSIPIAPSDMMLRDQTCFFKTDGQWNKKGRKYVSWTPYYLRDDVMLNAFLDRFAEDGQLCFGEKRYYNGRTAMEIRLQGILLDPPKPKKSKEPKIVNLQGLPIDGTEYVYVIQLGRTRFFKIGKSNDPEKRLASLQTANPQKLKLVNVFQADNATAAEQALHAALANHRQEGEWFRLSAKQEQTIKKITSCHEGNFWIQTNSISLDDLSSF